MKKTTEEKDYFQLREFVGFNHAEVAPIAAVQAVDDVDNAAGAHSVEDPANLDRLNAYVSQINDHQHLNPFYALNTLWRKLQIIGLNFDLRSISFRGGSHGISEAPLNQFGGRYGYINADGTIGHDDGISARIPGGLKLVIHWINTNGIYTMTALIERNHQDDAPFLETAMAEGLKPSDRSGKTRKADSAKTKRTEGNRNAKEIAALERDYQDRERYDRGERSMAEAEGIVNEAETAVHPLHKTAVSHGYKHTGPGVTTKSPLGDVERHNYAHENGNTLELGLVHKGEGAPKPYWKHETKGGAVTHQGIRTSSQQGRGVQIPGGTPAIPMSSLKYHLEKQLKKAPTA